MGDGRAGQVVAGGGAVVVIAGLYNLITLPEIPDDEGLVARLVRAAGDDFAEILEWVATTAVVNSVALIVVGVALIVVGRDMMSD